RSRSTPDAAGWGASIRATATCAATIRAPISASVQRKRWIPSACAGPTATALRRSSPAVRPTALSCCAEERARRQRILEKTEPWPFLPFDALTGQGLELDGEFGDHELIEAHPLPCGLSFEGSVERLRKADNESAALLRRSTFDQTVGIDG